MDSGDGSGAGMVRVAALQELEGVRFKAVKLLGKHIAVFKRADGSFDALEMSCKHQGADLTQGRFSWPKPGEPGEGEVTCPRHGWRYSLATGACLNQEMSPSLRRHGVRVEGDGVFVSTMPLPRGGMGGGTF